MTERNMLQKVNAQSHSQSGQSETQPEVHELESPPPSYEAALTGSDGRNQGQTRSHAGVSQPGVDEAQFWRHQEEQWRQAEQERQQRQELQRRVQEQEPERQRLQELAQQYRQQAQQQEYPNQEYASSTNHYEPDAKYPVTTQQDFADLEAQRPAVASCSGQVQTDPRSRRGHGCQLVDGKQKPGNCCIACFSGCLAGCAACCYCCVVM